MSATVTCLFGGSPPCSWRSLPEEASVSLKDQIPLLSHQSDHWSCSSPCVDLLFSPSCSSCDMVFTLFCWIVKLINAIHVLKTYGMVMNVTYYNLRIDNWKSFYVGKICDMIGEVCHGKVCGCILCRLSEMLTMEGGMTIAVNCCVALSFSTSKMTSVRI